MFVADVILGLVILLRGQDNTAGAGAGASSVVSAGPLPCSSMRLVVDTSRDYRPASSAGVGVGVAVGAPDCLDEDDAKPLPLGLVAGSDGDDGDGVVDDVVTEGLVVAAVAS